MELLHLATEHVDGATVVIALKGELDAATTPQLKRTIAEVVSRGHNRLVLDLAQLEFLDSTGIGAFVGAQARVREGNGTLHLRAVPERVRSVLRVVGLDSVLLEEPQTSGDLTGRGLALR
jgi:anti-sigma B factor antagonist